MRMNIDNILQPKKALEEWKEKLLSLYQEDYGEKRRGLLEARWNQTIFILDANPKDKRDFLKRNKVRKLHYLQAQLECLDYQRKEKALEEAMHQEFKEYLQDRHNIYSEYQINELWTGNRLLKYKFGYNVVSDAIEKRKELVQSKKESLIENTIWGRKLQKKHPELTIPQLAEIVLSDTDTASTSILKDKRGITRTICFLPIMKNMPHASIDRMVLHELRHVVETGDNRIGLEDLRNPRYRLLNEIRTQKNAVRDERRCPILFGRIDNDIQSYYDLFVRKLEELDVYQDLFNEIAMTGDEKSYREILENINNRLQEIEKEWNRNLQKRKNVI